MTDTATHTIPSDLAGVDDSELVALLASAETAFDALHDAGTSDLRALTSAADDIDRLRHETRRRESSSRRRPALRDVASRAPAPSIPKASNGASAALIASATGEPIASLTGIAVAMHETSRRLDGNRRSLVASVTVPTNGTLSGNAADDAAMIAAAVGQPTAEALIASGGWCAPSQPAYDVFDLAPELSVFDLPTFGGAVRAGTLIPETFDIGDVAGALWTWTEANDIAAAQPDGPTKPCLAIPCPSWAEYRLEAEGLCVTHGNLSDRAWPELTRGFVSLVFGAHLHRVSASKIAKIFATSIAVAPVASPSDATGDLLSVIALQAADTRSQYRLSRRTAIDVLLPVWTLDVLRSNVAMRAGVDLLNVTDAEIVTWFASRGVRAQFTGDWQPLHAVPGTPTTTWPAQVEVLLWVSGSYVTLDGGRIDLGVVRDSTLNATNDFTAAWTEQFFQVARRGPQARRFTVPLNIDGVTACCPSA